MKKEYILRGIITFKLPTKEWKRMLLDTLRQRASKNQDPYNYF